MTDASSFDESDSAYFVDSTDDGTDVLCDLVITISGECREISLCISENIARM